MVVAVVVVLVVVVVVVLVVGGDGSDGGNGGGSGDGSGGGSDNGGSDNGGSRSSNTYYRFESDNVHQIRQKLYAHAPVLIIKIWPIMTLLKKLAFLVCAEFINITG